MLRTLLRHGDGILQNLIPGEYYCKLDDVVRRWVNPARRGGKKGSCLRSGDTYCVFWNDGTRFHFSYPNRHYRYVWPDGAEHIFREMLGKYQDGDACLRPGDIVIEAGANVGEFTCPAARIAAHVYAVEPDPAPRSSLIKNTAKARNVTVEPYGLGAVPGEADFYLSGKGADSSIVRPSAWTDVARVEVTTVEHLMETHKINHLGFLKVEAEGFEPEVLEGCGQRLRSIRAIAVDCSPERHGQSPFEQCDGILRRAGFRTWRRDHQGKIPMLFGINPVP